MIKRRVTKSTTIRRSLVESSDMAFDVEEFLIAFSKATGVYKQLHTKKGLNEPTLDEMAWAPFWVAKKHRKKLLKLYCKTSILGHVA